jgi:hypothetical protein
MSTGILGHRTGEASATLLKCHLLAEIDDDI